MRHVYLAAILTAVVGLMACGSSGGSGGVLDDDGREAKILFINATPDRIDIGPPGETWASDVALGEATGYRLISVSNRFDIEFRVAGQPSTVLHTEDALSLGDGRLYTMTLRSDGSTYSMLLMQEDLEPQEENIAYVRSQFTHPSASGPYTITLSGYNTATLADEARYDRPGVVAFTSYSLAPEEEGSFSSQLTITHNETREEQSFGPFDYEAGEYYTLLIYGRPDDPPETFQVFTLQHDRSERFVSEPVGGNNNTNPNNTNPNNTGPSYTLSDQTGSGAKLWSQAPDDEISLCGVLDGSALTVTATLGRACGANAPMLVFTRSGEEVNISARSSPSVDLVSARGGSISGNSLTGAPTGENRVSVTVNGASGSGVPMTVEYVNRPEDPERGQAAGVLFYLYDYHF